MSQTIREKMIVTAVSLGMLEEDVKIMIEDFLLFAKEEMNMEADINNRIDDYLEGYPPQIFHIMWVTVSFYAEEWLEKHKPKAWYRPNFSANPKQKMKEMYPDLSEQIEKYFSNEAAGSHDEI